MAEVLDRITDSFFVLDRQGRFTDVNRRAEEMFQKPREALLGHSIWALFPQAAERRVFDKYREAVQEQRPVHFEETLPVQRRCFEVRLYPDTEGTSVFFRDITDRKRTEAVLRESEDRFRSLVVATSQIVWITSPTGEAELEQPGWSAFTGQSTEEYRELGWLDAVHPEDRARTIEVFSAALRDRRPYERSRTGNGGVHGDCSGNSGRLIGIAQRALGSAGPSALCGPRNFAGANRPDLLT